MSLLPKLFCYLGIIIGCFSPILSYIYMYQSNKISTSINDVGKEHTAEDIKKIRKKQEPHRGSWLSGLGYR